MAVRFLVGATQEKEVQRPVNCACPLAERVSIVLTNTKIGEPNGFNKYRQCIASNRRHLCNRDDTAKFCRHAEEDSLVNCCDCAAFDRLDRLVFSRARKETFLGANKSVNSDCHKWHGFRYAPGTPLVAAGYAKC